MSGPRTELHALVRKKAPHIIWPHCVLHRQALSSINMSEELQTVFQTVIRFVNYVKNIPLIGRLFAKLRDDIETEHMAPL